MNYTINQLRVFLKVVETKSVTKAALELHMTQPAVSIQLKNFQDQFKIPLTEVVGRTLYITEFGLEVANYAEQVFLQLDQLKFLTKEFEGLLSGSLKVSVASTGKYVVPFFMARFINDHPGVDLKLDVTNKAKVVESLKLNEIDFAVVSVIPDEVEVEEELLVENKLFLFGSSENSTKKMPLIYREPGSATRKVMEEFFKENKYEQKRMELTSNEAVKQAVLAGIGHSILPLIGIKSELMEGSLKIIPRKGLPITTQWRLVWLKNKKLSPVAKAFLKFLRENKDDIRSKHFDWSKDVNAQGLSK